MVILCERSHYELIQYEMIINLIRDQRFIDKVGNIFIEIGSITQNTAIQEFLNASYPNDKELEGKLIKIFRNLHYEAIWEKYPLYFFLKELARSNNSLPAGKKVKLFFADMPINWENMIEEKYQAYRKTLSKRDRILAKAIIQKLNKIKQSRQARKKALVIMNYRHAFSDFNYDDGRNRDNVGRHLFEK